jgi:hypothetical protein
VWLVRPREAVRRYAASLGQGSQHPLRLLKELLQGKPAGQPDIHPAHADGYQSPDLEQPQADRAGCRPLQNRVWKRQGAQAFQQQIGEGAQPEPQLIGGHEMGARAISVQIQKLLLDLIFRIAAPTVKPFIALAPLGRPALKWSHRQRKLIPAKGVVSNDVNLLNIRLAFDADLSKGRTEGASKSYPSSHRRLIRQEENRVLRYET